MSGKIILLIGPTCVGKTEVAILIAKALGAEIISADSMQIYRHMDIGTGKPSKEQLREVKHHMIDIVEPSEGYSAGRYIEDVVPIIEGLHARGKVPVVVGGTGLYIKAMTRGLFSGPSADDGLRQELLKDPPGVLYERLRRLDPEAARGIMPSDARRIVRALEVCIKSGEKVSELKRSLTSPLSYEFIKIGIERDRGELYRMIEERVDRMVERGLVEEVRRVLLLNPNRTPMQAIGYKEMADCIKEGSPIREAVRLIKRNTKRYAKRQFTWFRKEEGIKWVDVTGLYGAEEIFGEVRRKTG